MALLSRELAGVILPHKTFGTHLDSNGETMDPELGRRNFEHVGKILADIWLKTVIDGKPTICEYIDSMASENVPIKDEEWLSQHIRQGQYCLQITKRGNEKCCSAMRSSVLNILPNRFLPPPFPLSQTADGPSWAISEKNAVYPTLTQALVM